MLLTEQRLHVVAMDARSGLRDCLSMIQLHDRDRSRSYLNGPIVLTAAATWERFILDLIGAAEKSDSEWDPTLHWFDSRGLAGAPWPGGNADLRESHPGHTLNYRLTIAGVLAEPLTSTWRIRLATRWTGSNATGWIETPDVRGSTEVDITTQRHLLGAKSARDAIGHRLFYKKASDADVRDASDPDSIDERLWHYVWASDNTEKSGLPTIQNGYARSVVAMFIQLVDSTIGAIRMTHGWRMHKSRLPRQWFDAQITEGRLVDAEFWNGRRLLRFQ